MSGFDVLIPDWPAAAAVRAFSTTRTGGVSGAPFATLNLGMHSGDEAEAVTANRSRLNTQLPAAPAWLQQVHGKKLVELPSKDELLVADGAWTREADAVCVVQTADCLPLLLCHRKGTQVAALHCGWRGIAAGIIEAGVNAFDCARVDVLAWMGPAIGAAHYEVGSEVYSALSGLCPGAESAFRPVRAGHWYLDLYGLVRAQLATLGIAAVYGGQWCTYAEETRFFSYRRDGATGRQASLIWLAST